MSDQYLTRDELKEVIEVCDYMANISQNYLGLGPVPVSDTNGETLGYVARSPNDAGEYVFFLANPEVDNV